MMMQNHDDDDYHHAKSTSYFLMAQTQGKVRLRCAGSLGVQCLIGLTSKTGPEYENDDHDDLDIDINQNILSC